MLLAIKNKAYSSIFICRLTNTKCGKVFSVKKILEKQITPDLAIFFSQTYVEGAKILNESNLSNVF
jgi:hypothetical protein